MAQEPSDPKDPLAVYSQIHREAFKAGDVNLLESHFEDEAILMPPNETTLYGRAEIREWHEEYFQFFKLQVRNETEREVTIIGEWAFERTASMIAVVPVKGGNRIRDDIRMLTVWRRQPDGEWKIAQMMWNSIRPVGVGTSRFLARMDPKKIRPF